MGATGAILGGTLLGLGMAGMSKSSSYSTASEVHSTMVPSMPETPEAPVSVTETPEADGQQNALMEAAREKERQAALLRQQQAQEVFTSGLGASGLADTSKKTLLGG